MLPVCGRQFVDIWMNLVLKCRNVFFSLLIVTHRIKYFSLIAIISVVWSSPIKSKHLATSALDKVLPMMIFVVGSFQLSLRLSQFMFCIEVWSWEVSLWLWLCDPGIFIFSVIPLFCGTFGKHHLGIALHHRHILKAFPRAVA